VVGGLRDTTAHTQSPTQGSWGYLEEVRRPGYRRCRALHAARSVDCPTHGPAMRARAAAPTVLLLAVLPWRASSSDPSWSSVSSLYPLLAHSREGLGIADHAAAAALEQGKQDDPICTVVFPTVPPACSPTGGACTTEQATVGSAYFSLELYSATGGPNVTVGLNCSHSSTRSVCLSVSLSASLPLCLSLPLRVCTAWAGRWSGLRRS
jgi:hypothetical protein